jgi:Spy/CpxP family protein refolding chaperone
MLPKRAPLVAIALLLASSAASVGCGSTHPLPPAEAAKLVDAPPDRQAAGAVDALRLTPAQQQATAALRQKLRDQLGDAAQARDELTAAVLASLEKGSVDHARVDPVIRAFVTAAERAKPSVLAALDELHAILTPEQRAALVGALDTRRDEGSEEGKGRVKKVIKALGLSFSQGIDIAKALKERLSGERDAAERLKAQLHAAAEAFRGDSFEAAKLEIATGPVVEHWVNVAVSVFEAIVPVLDAAQRATLVAMARASIGGDHGAP